MVTVFARAVDGAPGGRSLQVKIVHEDEPSELILNSLRLAVTTAYGNSFGEAPAFIGVAVLPYIEEIDGDEDQR